MLDKMDFDQRWRKTPPAERLKFMADQMYENNAGILSIQKTLVEHDGRITKLENANGNSNSGRTKQFFIGIGAVVAGVIAAVVAALKLLGGNRGG